jgi:hypothetical protein
MWEILEVYQKFSVNLYSKAVSVFNFVGDMFFQLCDDLRFVDVNFRFYVSS